jgi:hypothetical protein
LNEQNQLGRICIDEIHEIENVSTSFRSALDYIKDIRGRDYNVPMLFLSATCPPDFRGYLGTQFGMKNLYEVRGTKIRDNVFFHIVKEETEDMNATLTSLISSSAFNDEERGIVYFMGKRQLQAFASAWSMNADFFVYHGELSEQQRDSNYTNWISTSKSWMLATTAFSCGIDYPHVRHCIMFEGAFGLIELVQSSGRIGRDGIHSKCSILINKNQMNRAIGTTMSERKQVELQLLESTLYNGGCIYQTLNTYLFNSGERCLFNGTAKCSSCLELQTESILQFESLRNGFRIPVSFDLENDAVMSPIQDSNSSPGSSASRDMLMDREFATVFTDMNTISYQPNAFSLVPPSSIRGIPDSEIVLIQQFLEFTERGCPYCVLLQLDGAYTHTLRNCRLSSFSNSACFVCNGTDHGAANCTLKQYSFLKNVGNTRCCYRCWLPKAYDPLHPQSNECTFETEYGWNFKRLFFHCVRIPELRSILCRYADLSAQPDVSRLANYFLDCSFGAIPLFVKLVLLLFENRDMSPMNKFELLRMVTRVTDPIARTSIQQNNPKRQRR